METKVLRSAIETHPIIFRVLSHDSTLVCSIVGTVYVMNVFIIAAAEILTTRTKRPAIGAKLGRRFIYRPRKRRPNFSNIRTAYWRVAKVSIGVFVEPHISLSAGGALTWGIRGHAPPEIFENLGSQKLHFLHFETHFRQITTLFYSSFFSDIYIISTA